LEKNSKSEGGRRLIEFWGIVEPWILTSQQRMAQKFVKKEEQECGPSGKSEIYLH